MYMDVVVFAGIATVLLMVVFFVGVGIFIVRDQKANAASSGQAKKDIDMDRKAA